MKHVLPKLHYKYDALEPFIDAKTMEIHYTKHHQAYIDKLNSALEKHPNLQEKDVNEILKEINKLPEDIRNIVRNNGGGHSNHSFFWDLLKKDVEISGKILNAIEEEFGSFDDFKKKFSEAGINRFGSGWVWLTIYNDKLEIYSTGNQDSPLMEGKIPILGLDVWEHAYYLKYQNKRAEYINAFWNIINWQKVEENYQKALG